MSKVIHTVDLMRVCCLILDHGRVQFRAIVLHAVDKNLSGAERGRLMALIPGVGQAR